MTLGLIIVGDEILSGKREDKHLRQVIALLAERGLQLGWARIVGDDPPRLTADLRDALAGAARSGDIVFCCGGIGATPDDHTRQCAGAALGRPLVMHPQAQALIIERMQQQAAEKGEAFDPAHPDNIHRLNMAMFPEGAEIIPNSYNKIAGFAVRQGAGGVFCVPGFPVMAWPMIAWVLDHHCQHLRPAIAHAERSVIVLRGVEGALTPLMLALETRFANIKVFSLPSVDHPQWGRHVELGIKGPADALEAPYRYMLQALRDQGADLGPELGA
jgi:molybdopterin-biosynthesis enzyme MoeA-like protein